MKLVVALDGSPQAAVAAAFVRTLALSPADEVVLASVVMPSAILGAWGYVQLEGTLHAIEEGNRAAREEAERIVAGEAGRFAGLSCRVATRVLEGHPLQQLAALAAETGADLIVAGPHGRARLPALLFGSVTNGLLQQMPSAVLVARGPAREPRRVLLATDGSPASAAGAALLARLPLRHGAEILAVSCVSRRGELGREPVAHAIREHAEVALGRAAASLRAPGRNVRVELLEGEAKEQILVAAEESGADLIVLGSRGLGGFRGLVLGSVSRAVCKAARVSALVVPEARGKGHGA